MSTETYTWHLTDDPADSMAPDDRIVFVSNRVNLPGGNNEVKAFRKRGVLAGMVQELHVHNKTTDEMRIQGSGVMVAPGVILCATHVIGELLDDPELALMFMAVTDAGVNLWQPQAVYRVPNSDISLVVVRARSSLPPSRTYNIAAITTRLPKVGERLSIVGIAQDLDLSKKNGRVTSDAFVSTGIVERVYPTKRDSVMMPWPVVSVEAHSFSGMSGGPVFDQSGRLIGIVGTSFEGDSVSFVTLLWTALGMKFQGGWPGWKNGADRTLLTIPPTFCDIDKREAVQCIYTSEGYYSIYTPWTDHDPLELIGKA